MRSIREGEKWFFEVRDILTQFFDLESLNYMGFENAVFKNKVHLCGIFELNRGTLPNEEFFNLINNYHSDKINSILYYKEISSYQNCIIVVLN